MMEWITDLDSLHAAYDCERGRPGASGLVVTG